MPKRISRLRRPSDINQLVHQLVQESTGEQRVQPVSSSKLMISLVMAEMGRRGGKIGGKRRLKTMTAKERKTIAQKAAKARSSKK